HLHGHFAAQTFDDADHVWIFTARRHEIDQPYRAAVGFNFRFENQRLVTITATRCRDFLCRKKAPVPIFLFAKQRCKTCRRIKSWKAKPIDAAVAAHQHAGLRVTQETVSLNLCSCLSHFTASSSGSVL